MMGDCQWGKTLRLILVTWLIQRFQTNAFCAPQYKARSFTTALPSTKKETSRPKKNRRRKQKQKVSSRERREPATRELLTDYAENRNGWVNEERLSSPINCQHFDTCPGCVVNEKVGDVDIIKSAKLYFSSTSVKKRRMDLVNNFQDEDDIVVEEAEDDFFRVVVPSPLTEWRTQAKLAVAPKTSSWSKDGCSFGLYARGTHKVQAIPDCKVHHPAINRAVKALEEATAKVGTAAYDENSGEGGLRYVQFQVDRVTGRICLTLVWNAELLKQTQPALSRLCKALRVLEPDLWHSMWCHCNDGVGNNIFSRNPNRWHRLLGPEFVREPIPVGDEGWFYFTPTAFRQGNMDGFDIIALDVARAVPGQSRVCELYGGVGILGLTSLAYHAQEGNTPLTWLRCSDENPSNPRCFKRAVDSLPSDVTERDGWKSQTTERQAEKSMTVDELVERLAAGENLSNTRGRKKEKTSYMVASASKALREGQALGADVLIVDPPRKGLEADVLAELCKPINSYQDFVEDKALLAIPDHKVNWFNDIKTIVYVSCGFDALARDCERLLSSQAGWVLQSATGYVLFPGSDHVETLCVFKRR